MFLVYADITSSSDARDMIANRFLLRGTGVAHGESSILAVVPQPALSTVRVVDISIYADVKCTDGVTVGKMNDNYCDCLLDGEDEPNTGACSGFVKPAAVLYECAPARQHYLPKMRIKTIKIYSSRIRDGICDCVGCSDEK
jgi:hypothetical protein